MTGRAPRLVTSVFWPTRSAHVTFLPSAPESGERSQNVLRLLPQQGALIWNRLLRTRSAQPRKTRTGSWRVQLKKKHPFVSSSELGVGWGGGAFFQGDRNVLGVTVIRCDGRAPVQHSFEACFVHLYLLTCAWGRRSAGQPLLMNTEMCSFPAQVGSGGAFL